VTPLFSRTRRNFNGNQGVDPKGDDFRNVSDRLSSGSKSIQEAYRTEE
jgi:hypothetical protein